jgi:CubicO group peptidase (beta-lactamase class C family)
MGYSTALAKLVKGRYAFFPMGVSIGTSAGGIMGGLTRRDFTAAAGLAWLYPELAAAQAAPPMIAWHDRSEADHQTELNNAAALGYRTISLCMYGEPSAPLYASVMVRFSTAPAQRQFFGMTENGAQARFNEQAGQGWGPILITATGPIGNARISMVFAPMNPIPLSRFGLTQQEFQSLNEQAWADRTILRSFDAYGTPQDTRYCAIWTSNSNLDGWSCPVVNASTADTQVWFDAQTASGARPLGIAVTPGGGYVETFTDSVIGQWQARADLTSASYQAAYDAAVGQGMIPIQVAAKGSGANTKFAALFARRTAAPQRTFRKTGPSTIAAIDAPIETMMRAHGMRAIGLAITRGSRLVYARGYTWAEDDYPTTQPQTLFRQASVSKTFVAAAMMRLIQQQAPVPGTTAPVTLETHLQDILNLKQPNDANPADAKFAQIKIKHLLTSTSGLDQSLLWHSAEAAAAFNGALPCTPEQLARYATQFTFVKSPGDTTNVVYGNFDYFLLGLAVARLANTPTFEGALTPLVLNRLQMTRTRGSRTLLSEQANDEARYHLHVHDPRPNVGLYPLPIAPSIRNADRPYRGNQYGAWDYELFDGCGGLSSSVLDVARLVAMLSAGGQNGCLTANTISTWMQNTVVASSYTGPDVHGFFGLDWAQAVDAPNNVYRTAKGGYIPGHESYFEVVTGGFGFIIAANCNKFEVGFQDWLTPVRNAAMAQAWGDADLFPSYGMPAFGPLPNIYASALANSQPRLSAASVMNMNLNSARQAITRTPRLSPGQPIPRPTPPRPRGG